MIVLDLKITFSVSVYVFVPAGWFLNKKAENKLFLCKILNREKNEMN